ncbi:hypothetical protein EYF80_001039 [Liparis tanakae]|uniref:Uncharacterized protein n=1 Tax=Liparis tanakae TaxID=230148 RepID=A0A4Z2JFE8_9TELE|nr:hypothetical protein EYF80_001039 [Liparis tanakae]
MWSVVGSHGSSLQQTRVTNHFVSNLSDSFFCSPLQELQISALPIKSTVLIKHSPSYRRTVGIAVHARHPVISPATVKSSPWSKFPARALLAISPGNTTSQRTTSGTAGMFTMTKLTDGQRCGA